MLPPKTDARWQAIATGKTPVVVSSLAAQMLIKRVTTSVQSDPTPANVSKHVNELHAFFEKFPHTISGELAAFLG